MARPEAILAAKLSKADVYKTNVGNKDSTKSHFSVWEELFQIPRSSGSNKRKHDGKSEENCAALNVRFKNSLHMAQSCGDYEKLQQGVFENYLNIKFKDDKMQNVLGMNIFHNQLFFLILLRNHPYITSAEDWVGGSRKWTVGESEKVQNYDDVIYGWSLN